MSVASTPPPDQKCAAIIQLNNNIIASSHYLLTENNKARTNRTTIEAHGDITPFVGQKVVTFIFLCKKMVTQHQHHRDTNFFVRHRSKKTFIYFYSCFLLLDGDRLQALEGRHGDIRRYRVQSLLGILIVVSLARQTDTYAVRHVAYTALPDFLVETGVDAHVGSTHVLLGELADHFDGTWRFSLVAILADVWVQMDRVVTGDHFRASGFAIAWYLFYLSYII